MWMWDYGEELPSRLNRGHWDSSCPVLSSGIPPSGPSLPFLNGRRHYDSVKGHQRWAGLSVPKPRAGRRPVIDEEITG